MSDMEIKQEEEMTADREEAQATEDAGKKKQRKQPMFRFVVIAVVAALIVLAVYIRLTNHSKNSDQQAEANMTEVQVLEQYDFENLYPKTARDVVKLHCRLLKCMYNEELTEEELEQLNRQARQIYASDLLDANEETEQFRSLLQEVEEFQEAGKRYISYSVDPEEDVVYQTNEENENMALIYVTNNMKEGSDTNEIHERYLLRQEDGNWKIVGWQIAWSIDESQ